MRKRLCHWRCGRRTDRICGICLECCKERDERDRQIDAGAVAYVPPDKRPGHRFYKADKPKRVISDAHKEARAQARRAKSMKRIAGTARIATETMPDKNKAPSTVSQPSPEWPQP